MTTTGEPVPLSVLALDLPAPATGWAAELARRGSTTVVDDVGRVCVARDVARVLLAEHRADQAHRARVREEQERRAVAEDEARRAALPAGVPLHAVPAGISPGMFLMAADEEMHRRAAPRTAAG